MLENICTLPLRSELFAQAVHPSAPLVAVGLSSGHVQTFKLPPISNSSKDGSSSREDSLVAESHVLANTGSSTRILNDGVQKQRHKQKRLRTSDAFDETERAENGFGTVETIWETHRHKGSCRSLCFGVNGTKLYSAGSDGIVKIAETDTGIVTAKIAVPRLATCRDIPDLPCSIHALSENTLLLATDSSRLHIYDLRQPPIRPQQTHRPHIDYITSITTLPSPHTPVPHTVISTGGTTLAVTDTRKSKGIIAQSEDQECELLSSGLAITPTVRQVNKETVVTGTSEGVLLLWDRDVWDDQRGRIILSKDGEPIDSLVTVPKTFIPTGANPRAACVAAGLGNGHIRIVEIGGNHVLQDLSHDDFTGESVSALGFESEGRMISGGGSVVKIWQENEDFTGLQNYDTDMSDGSESDNDSNEDDDSNKYKKRRKDRDSVATTKSKGVPVSFEGLD